MPDLQNISWVTFGPLRRIKPLPVPMRFQAANAIRNGNGGYTSNNTRFGKNGYFLHSFGPQYVRARIYWSIGATQVNSNWELFAREYQPAIGNQQLSSATQNPIPASMLNISGPFPPNNRYVEYVSDLFDVTHNNLYELGLRQLSGGGNLRLYSANFVLYPAE